MDTESFRGLRAKIPMIIDDYCLATLDEIYEIIYAPDKKEITIKIVGGTLCIE